MYVYIGFTDKNTHAIRFCNTEKEMDEFKSRWEDNYILELVFTTPAKFGENKFYRAKEKKHVHGDTV